MDEMADGAGLKTVALDAMGVIYPVGGDGDDVKNLLVPFIRKEGGSEDIGNIERLYLQASLGKLTAFQFWKKRHAQPSRW